jgi:cyclophilin family peptidyl-prolyl cis-trans isomerase
VESFKGYKSFKPLMPNEYAMLRKFFLTFSALFLTAFAVHAQEAEQPAPAPASVSPEENILYLDLSTGGRVAIQLFADLAPAHVERIKTLTRQGFYDGIIFHRVIEGFMAQTGDPTGTGTGGSDLPDLKAEFGKFPHMRGVVSMARSESEDSANSQFFIVFYPRFSLDGKYSAFGRVISGMEYVDKIARGEPPLTPSRILQASIAADQKPPVLPSARASQTEAPISVDDLNAPINP